jgi:hypothetical protein
VKSRHTGDATQPGPRIVPETAHAWREDPELRLTRGAMLLDARFIQSSTDNCSALHDRTATSKIPVLAADHSLE